MRGLLISPLTLTLSPRGRGNCLFPMLLLVPVLITIPDQPPMPQDGDNTQAAKQERSNTVSHQYIQCVVAVDHMPLRRVCCVFVASIIFSSLNRMSQMVKSVKAAAMTRSGASIAGAMAGSSIRDKLDTLDP